MPRVRTIKPQFWLDENLGKVSRDVRLLYIGLWNLSDDHGVFEWRPQKIKIQLCPYDTDIDGEKIERWLEELVAIGDIMSFEYENKKYGFIPTFLSHQDIKNPSKWTFAPVPEAKTATLPQPYPSPAPALPLGNRYIGNRLKYINSVFQHWNNQGIIIHRKLTPEIERRISSALKEYTEDEINAAISNYATIQKGDYWFKYKWTLSYFLTRKGNIERWQDLEICKENFKNKTGVPEKKKGADGWPI
jgi:hypothetical protein